MGTLDKALTSYMRFGSRSSIVHCENHSPGVCRGHQITPHDQSSSLKSRHQFPLRAMNIAVVDIGKPGANFGWAMVGDTTAEGTDIDVCVQTLAAALRNGPLALGFEAPMFVPIRTDPKRLTAARSGEFGKGLPSRPFSASAGATSLVTGMVVVSYILNALLRLCPRRPPRSTGDCRLSVLAG
jgi:hypothetical protein